MKISLKTLLTFGLLFAIISNSQATEITNTSATGTTFKFSATLDAPLTTGNKVKIDFGKGLKAMTCSAKTCMLSSNALPSGISTATYKVGIYDAKNVLQGSTSDGTYVIISNSSAPVSNYIKIANDGSELSDEATLGTNPKDWACTKDNKTGLIWDIKTKDGGLRDWKKTYSQDSSGVVNSVNVNSLIASVNSDTLCNASDWRIPTIEELKSIVYCSDSNYNSTKGDYDIEYVCGSNNKNTTKTKSPTINTNFFPNLPTPAYSFWSSTPYDGLAWRDILSNMNVKSYWMINFDNGSIVSDFLSNEIMLVRNAQ